jgi:hypothetical protein
MANTHPPSAPPSAPPKSGGGAFIGAAIVMLLLMGGLIYWKMNSGDDDSKAALPPPTPAPAPVLDEPPPPPPVEIDAGEAQEAPKSAKRVVVTGGCDGECKGSAPGALQAALRTKAGQARGCYERALRQNATLEGRLSVNVRVGPRGQVCSASIGSDNLQEAGVTQCVLQMFRSATLPLPAGGCVDTQVPMYFKPKS